MTEAQARMPRGKALAGLGGALLLVTLIAAYANHFHNSFHFDDSHTIVNNASIRELQNIPLFFRDATTFSALPSNQSYRPLVSTLLAIDYKLAGGLQPFWFHLSVFALFVPLTLLLAFVAYRLLEYTASSSQNCWIALIAAAWYGLHPANADTVNYIIASSEVISTLGVIASFAVYFAFPGVRRYHLYVLPAAIAILAKPPAAIFAVLFAIFHLLFPGEKIKRRAFTRIVEVTLVFFVCGRLVMFVQNMTPRSWVSGAASAHNYLITQPYVAWLYFKTFFWPTGLSADYDLNPFTTTDDPRFWAGFAFSVLFIAVAITAAAFKKTRFIGFGLLWFLIALLPTSLFPLAEVINDHRTFLPYVGLVIAMAGAASLVVARFSNGSRAFGRTDLGLVRWLNPDVPQVQEKLRDRRGVTKIVAVAAVTLFLGANAYATFQRNKVWRNEETLWHDVVIKSPGNARGLMNYGNTLMAKGDYKGALDYFRRAQVFAPFYSVLFVNLGVAEGSTGQAIPAEQHFKEALLLAPSNPDSYTFYARWLLTQSRAPEALRLLRKAVELGPADISARDLLAQAEKAGPATQTAESYLVLSHERYGEKRYEEAIEACRLALALRPDYAEAWNNIGASYNAFGQYDKGAAACEEALCLKPDFELARNNLRYAQEMAKPSVKERSLPPSRTRWLQNSIPSASPF